MKTGVNKILTVCAKIGAIGVFVGLAIFTAVSCASRLTSDAVAVRDKLESEWWKTFGLFNYHNVCSRQWDDGFFEESPSGAYLMSYFTRTSGPLTKLWLNTGDPDRVKRLLTLTFQVAAAEGNARMPHVISPAVAGYRLPIEGTDIAVQPDMSQVAYHLNNSDVGAQRFIATDRPVIAVVAGFTWGSTGTVTATISKKPDGEAIASVVRERKSSPGGFFRFAFDKPVALKAGEEYYLQIKWEGIGPLVWQGKIDGNKSRVAAFAIDTGTLEHSVFDRPASVYSMADQIDGQAHAILSWALYINQIDDTAFADETYEQVAALMNSSVRPPYMTGEGELGNLIYNSNFEHHRESYYLTTYDMLSQSFVAQALREMIRVAKKRGDAAHAQSWAESLAQLEAAIAEKMTWTLDGQKIYAEMYKKEMDGTILDGLSWVNLAVTASGWEGVDEELYAATIAMYAKKASFIWKGHTVLGIEYTGDRELARSAIGKGIGWEMLYYAQRGNWKRVSEILDFVYDAHEGNAQRLYGESFHMPSEDSTIVHQDPGNGEQTTWFLCCLFEVRKLLHLSALP